MTTINDYVRIERPFFVTVETLGQPGRPRSQRFGSLEKAWAHFDALTPEWQAVANVRHGQRLFGETIWPIIDRDGEVVQ